MLQQTHKTEIGKEEKTYTKICTFTIKPTKYIESIIWEESLVVQSVGEQLCHGRAAHPFIVLVLVQLQK